MIKLIWIAAGGAAGALLRYWTSGLVHAVMGRGFPYGTLSVNVSGSILIGLCYVYLVERTGAAEEWRAALMVGLLGSFTTFSSFSLETLNLVEAGESAKALLNAGLSVVLCLAGCWAGILAARHL